MDVELSVRESFEQVPEIPPTEAETTRLIDSIEDPGPIWSACLILNTALIIFAVAVLLTKLTFYWQGFLGFHGE